jgi:hypothetical protein
MIRQACLFLTSSRFFWIWKAFSRPGALSTVIVPFHVGMEATKTAQQNTLLPFAIRPPALKAVRVFLIGVPLILNEVGKRILDPAF